MKIFSVHTKLIFGISFFLLVSFCVSYSQTAKDLDSLWKVYNKNENPDTAKLKALDKISYIYSNTNPDSSIILAELFLREAQRIKSRRFESSAYNNLGSAYNSKNDFGNSILCFQKSIKIKEEMGDERGSAASYQNIGNIYNSQKNFSEALRYYSISLKIKEKYNNRRGTAITLNGIGNVYVNLGKTDSAIFFLQKAIDIYKSLDEKQGYASVLLNMGNALIVSGKTKEALKIYEENLILRIESGDKRGAAKSYSMIGNANNILGNFKEGIKNCEKALELSLQTKTPDNIQFSYYCLADAYEGVGDFKKALYFHRKYAVLRDSLFNEERVGEVSKKEAEFTFSKKSLADSLKNTEEKKIKDLAIAEKNAIISKNETQRYALIGGIALLLALGFVILRALRQKQKTNVFISRQREIAQRQNILMEEKNKNILDSINYAKRIQEAILPSDQTIKSLLPESFVLFQPKDIVSGDFYFIEPIRMNDGTQMIGFAAADCTGHGVPGAFMSIIGTNILSNSLKQKDVNSSGEALDFLNRELNIALRQKEKDQQVRDGMDISFCVFMPSTMDLYFAGANNPAYVVSNGILKVLLGDKQPVGYYEKQNKFTTQNVKLQKGDSIYLFSDGYADQFGGPKGKKLKYKQLKEKLVSVNHLKMEDQKQELLKFFIEWKGNLEQVDDILIIGVRV